MNSLIAIRKHLLPLSESTMRLHTLAVLLFAYSLLSTAAVVRKRDNLELDASTGANELWPELGFDKETKGNSPPIAEMTWLERLLQPIPPSLQPIPRLPLVQFSSRDEQFHKASDWTQCMIDCCEAKNVGFPISRLTDAFCAYRHGIFQQAYRDCLSPDHCHRLVLFDNESTRFTVCRS